MPGTYTKNVILTGDSNTAGPDYTLVNVNNVAWASGIISSDATSCSFTVSDWTNPPNLSDTRSAEFQIRHWLYNEANPLEEHYDSFTITQYANNGAEVTTTTEAPAYTIKLNQGAGYNLTASGIALEIPYTIGPVDLLLSEAEFTGPSWVEFSTSNAYSGGIAIYVNVSTNTSTSGRNGTITISHPDDPSVTSSITIAQAAAVVQTTTTVAPTTTTTVAPTTTTTAAPDPTIQFEEDSIQIPAGNTIVNLNFATQPDDAAAAIFTPISASADPTTPGSIVFFQQIFVDGGFTQVNQPEWITNISTEGGNGNGQLTLVTRGLELAPLLGDWKIRMTHPSNGEVFDEIAVTKLRIREVKTYTFEWEMSGDNANYEIYNYPEHYEPQFGDDDITNLSQTYPDSTAGPNFKLRADFRGGLYQDNSASAPISENITINTVPLDQQDPPQPLVEFLTWQHDSTLDLWEAVFQVNSTNLKFPGSPLADVVASITAILGNDVAGTSTSLTYNVIIDNNESCHVTGTLMNLDGGLTKPVEDLQVGDILESYILDGLGTDAAASPWDKYSKSITDFGITKTAATVKSIRSSSWHEYFHINNVTKVTAEHPILIKRDSVISFKQVNDVELGDQYYSFGAWVNITSKVLIEEDITAYSIDVEESDVYMADGILWHNTDFGINKIADNRVS